MSYKLKTIITNNNKKNSMKLPMSHIHHAVMELKIPGNTTCQFSLKFQWTAKAEHHWDIAKFVSEILNVINQFSNHNSLNTNILCSEIAKYD